MSKTDLAVRERDRVERALARLDRLARLMDDQFELPLVKTRIGLDPLIGLIPGGGDWVAWVVSIYVLLEALFLRVPLRVLFGIGFNATADLLLGYVPGVGDVIDIVFKANRRSVNLLFEHFEARPRREARARVEIPESALQKPKSGPERWLFGAVLIAALSAVAIAPLVLLWFLLSGES